MDVCRPQPLSPHLPLHAAQDHLVLSADKHGHIAVWDWKKVGGWVAEWVVECVCGWVGHQRELL